MDKILALGWLGNIFFIVAVFALGRKSKIGFYQNMVANLAYVYQSILLNNSPLYCVSLLLIGLNIYAIHNWSKK
jgi:hypothetical protein